MDRALCLADMGLSSCHVLNSPSDFILVSSVFHLQNGKLYGTIVKVEKSLSKNTISKTH